MFHKKSYLKSGLYKSKCGIDSLEFRIHLKPLFSLIPDFEAIAKDVRPRQRSLNDNILECRFKWQQSQEYEFILDASQGELGGLPATVEVGRKIRILAQVNGAEVRTAGRGAEVNAVHKGSEGSGAVYPLKEKQKRESELRMCIRAELGGRSDESGTGITQDKCLVELTWNSSEKVLHIYPDFNQLTDDPYLIEFASGQMLIYDITTLVQEQNIDQQQQKKLDIQPLPQTHSRNFNRDIFEAPPDRNHFLSLLLFTFQTAAGFDYDRLHFKYTVSHTPSRTISHGATQTTRSNVKDLHHISHTFEMELKIPYGDEEEQLVDVLLEAFSVDLWNRERFHGHCRIKIPPTIPGQFKRELHFVREIGSFRESLERYFIGGHRRLRIDNERRENNNYYGQKMQSNGLVNIDYNVIVQHSNKRMTIKNSPRFDEGFHDKGRSLDVDAVISGFKECCLLAGDEEKFE